jgi:hypothetical protein
MAIPEIPELPVPVMPEIQEIQVAVEGGELDDILLRVSPQGAPPLRPKIQ